MAAQFVPLKKRQKQEIRAENAKKRGTWNGINPVTRKPPNPRAYNRAKVKRSAENITSAD